tara:strand:- start:47 stop:304 length:258 start_codon:yes stop_codon:yes gene_type:complete
MATHTITLTDTQEKCLKTVVADSKEWITNAAVNQARMAQENIIAALVTHCNNNEIAIATGIDAQVTQAYSLGVVEEASSIPPEME